MDLRVEPQTPMDLLTWNLMFPPHASLHYRPPPSPPAPSLSFRPNPHTQRTFHCPSYLSPLTHTNVPCPLMRPASHSPSYSLPSAKMYLRVHACAVQAVQCVGMQVSLRLWPAAQTHMRLHAAQAVQSMFAVHVCRWDCAAMGRVAQVHSQPSI